MSSDPLIPDAYSGASCRKKLASLVSGGIDSAVLLSEALAIFEEVHPIYVRVGAMWEDVELAHLRRYLKAIATPKLRPLTILHQPVADIYGEHWSLTGNGVPGADTEDSAVYLPGRNLLLLIKPLLWCRLRGIATLAIAPLGSNPFPDADDQFFDGVAALVDRAAPGTLAESGNRPLRVIHPYSSMNLHKVDVVRRGAHLPLEHTFSCIAPVADRHCGRCNKCAERIAGFAAAGFPDPTPYAFAEMSP